MVVERRRRQVVRPIVWTARMRRSLWVLLFVFIAQMRGSDNHGIINTANTTSPSHPTTPTPYTYTT